MLQFTFQDKKYRLEFERRQEAVIVNRKIKKGKETINETKTEKSKYPFTTARLLDISGSTPIVVAKAKVGCLPTDKFSHELGRQEALKLLTENMRRSLTKEVAKAFNAALWDVYVGRLNQPDQLAYQLKLAEQKVEDLKKRIAKREANTK